MSNELKKKRLVILISGTPGTGKTTIAQYLKKKYSANVLNLTELAIQKDFILEIDEERQTKIVDLKKLLPFLESFIPSHQDNLIIEGHYADVVPDHLTSVFIILRTEPHILEKRLKEKKFSPSKILENIQSEILGACTSAALETHEREKIYEVDTSNSPVDETIKTIQFLIERKPPTNIGKINWMRKLEESNELLRYFP